MRFLKVAHRGRHDHHVENTLEAFQEAYAAGCDMVEFDVQLSRDGVPVVFHDDDCRRLAGKAARVSDLDWEDLRRLELGGRSGPGAAVAYRIPTLEQTLAAIGSRAFYLELKVPDAMAGDRGYVETLAEKCARLVHAAGPHPDTFLASFHGGILRYLASAGLFPTLGGIFEDEARFREVHSGADPETALAIRYYSVSWKLFRNHLEDRRSDADAFFVWDIHGEADFRTALDAGVRGLVADDVDLMLRMETDPSRRI